MTHRDIPPEHRPSAAAPGGVAYLQKKAEILLRVRYLERLVASYIHQPRREVRQKLVEQRFDKFDGTGVRRVERRRIFLHGSPRRDRASFGEPGEMIVFRMRQPPLHVAEGVLVRHEFNALHLAIGVELAHLRRSKRVGLLPYLAVRGICERMLGVQLELVVPAPREYVDNLAQRPERRNAVAADVQHVAADIKHTRRGSESPQRAWRGSA